MIKSLGSNKQITEMLFEIWRVATNNHHGENEATCKDTVLQVLRMLRNLCQTPRSLLHQHIKWGKNTIFIDLTTVK